MPEYDIFNESFVLFFLFIFFGFFFIGLHKIWEMLYFQWQQNNLQEDKTRRNGKRAGDYVGYPAG